MRKVFELGGVVAAAVLIAFGITAIVMGVNGRSTVKLEPQAGGDRRHAGHDPDGDQGGGKESRPEHRQPLDSENVGSREDDHER